MFDRALSKVCVNVPVNLKSDRLKSTNTFFELFFVIDYDYQLNDYVPVIAVIDMFFFFFFFFFYSIAISKSKHTLNVRDIY